MLFADNPEKQQEAADSPKRMLLCSDQRPETAGNENPPESKVFRWQLYDNAFFPKLAKDVFIEIPVQGARFSDNFFDLLPGEKRVITIESPRFTGDEEIAVRHIRDTY